MEDTKASNSIYFKVFNEDCRRGGVLYNLDNSEFRTMIILQSYSDRNGKVIKEDGSGYSISELSDMIGMNFRTIKRSLMQLSSYGLVDISDGMDITITNFVWNQVNRKDNNRTGHSKLAREIARLNNNTLAQTRATNEQTKATRELKRSLQYIPIVDGDISNNFTGEIIENKGDEYDKD